MHLYKKDQKTKFVNNDFKASFIYEGKIAWIIKKPDLLNVKTIATGIFNTKTRKSLIDIRFPLNKCS